MNYSKLTPKQLLEMLKQASPDLYSRVLNDFNTGVGVFSGESPNLMESLKMYDVPQYAERQWDLGLLGERTKGFDRADMSTIMTPAEYDMLQNETINKLGEDGYTKDGIPLYYGWGANPYAFESDYFDASSDNPNSTLKIPTTGNIFEFPAASSADFFNKFSDEELLNLLPKDDGPLFDFNIYDLVEDYEGDSASLERHLRKNKNFRWD